MKAIDTPTLLRWLERARVAHVNRQLHEEMIAKLDPDGIHAFWKPILHRNYQGLETIRPAIGLLKLRDRVSPICCVLDFLPDDYNKMPDYKYDQDTASKAHDTAPSRD